MKKKIEPYDDDFEMSRITRIMLGVSLIGLIVLIILFSYVLVILIGELMGYSVEVSRIVGYLILFDSIITIVTLAVSLILAEKDLKKYYGKN